MLEFLIPRQEFLQCLKSVAVCSGKNHSLPAADWCKLVFDCSKGEVSLCCTDLDCFITRHCSFETITPQSCTFCVDASDFLRILGAINKEKVTFFVDLDGFTLKVYYGAGEMCLPIHESDNYPTHVVREKEYEFAIPSQVLSSCLSMSRPFMAADKLRPILCGVYLYKQFGDFGCCSTNVTSLFTESLQVDPNDFDGEEKGFVLNSACVPAVQSILNNDCNVRVGVDATNATFTTDLGEVVCRLPVGKYPNFRAILPQNYEQFVTVKRNLLSSCISRCTLCASSTTQMLTLSIKNDKIIVQSENIEFNKSAKEECVIEDTNIDDFKIGINSSTFITALNATNSDVVTLKFNTPTKPIEFIDGENERKTVICMPLQL